MPIEETRALTEFAFFAAANGFSGFRNYYAEIFPSKDFDAVFVLKGGPGTGKSSLMRDSANTLLPHGMQAEFFYCSSDPESLDGVILKKGAHRVAILDGTAPHTRCAEIPGIIDEIVCLGEFWDAKLLDKNKKEILLHMQQKENAFRLAYDYLAIAGNADASLARQMQASLNIEKLKAAVERFCRRFSSKKHYYSMCRIVSSIGMRGAVQLKTPWLLAEDITVINNPFGVARYFFNLLSQELAARKLPHIRLVSPLSEEICDGIILPEHKYAILIGADAAGDGKYINMNRFLYKEDLRIHRKDLRRLSKTRNDALEAAIESFGTAAEHHFALESYYSSAMDFKKKELRTAEICEKIADICF